METMLNAFDPDIPRWSLVVMLTLAQIVLLLPFTMPIWILLGYWKQHHDDAKRHKQNEKCRLHTEELLRNLKRKGETK